MGYRGCWPTYLLPLTLQVVGIIRGILMLRLHYPNSEAQNLVLSLFAGLAVVFCRILVVSSTAGMFRPQIPKKSMIWLACSTDANDTGAPAALIKGLKRWDEGRWGVGNQPQYGSSRIYTRVSQNWGVPFWGPNNNKDYSILGSILGSPHFGKLPYYDPLAHLPSSLALTVQGPLFVHLGCLVRQMGCC